MAENPVACAEFMCLFLRAFNDVFLGWEQGSNTQRREGCPFGRVRAWYWKPETGGRGHVHWHGCGVIANASPANVRDAIGNRILSRKVIHFLESMACQWMPAPFHSMPNMQPYDQSDSSESNRLELVHSCKNTLASMEIPLDNDELIRRFIATAALQLQQHEHSATCAKNGGASTDEECRLRLPRPIQTESTLAAEGLTYKRCSSTLSNQNCLYHL